MLSLLLASFMMAQQTGYYNGTEGKNGEELKSSLNDIIQDHTSFSYFFSKEVFKLSDADPSNPDNLILVYTGRSNPNGDYGTGGNQVNREHVYAKSHGDFGDVQPMDGDVHNLKPADASVNTSRSNKDFDNGGTQHSEATECFYTDSTWEARDEVKGDIARIIFYMATRYEGENGEMDLKVVDYNNTYPLPEHGKLSTLLQWNMMDPPDDFERNRNNVIYSYQQNRNPFIDDPNFANLIWGGAAVNPISIDFIQMFPEIAVATEAVNIAATIVNTANQAMNVSLFWGTAYDMLTNGIIMTAAGDVYSCDIPGQAEDATIYYKIVAADVDFEKTSVVYNYYVPKVFTGALTSIYDIQGQQDASPYDGQVVSTTGVVTANFGSSYFIQDGYGEWNGLMVYESGRNPFVGDSVIITGTIAEYYEKTELTDITDYYFISSNNNIPDPLPIQTGLMEEAYEGVLVKVTNAICTDDDYQASGNFYMWKVDDGTGDLRIHNTSVYEYEPVLGSYYDIVGPMNYDFDEWKIELSPGYTVTGGTDTEGPLLTEVTPLNATNIKVIFNENVEATTAEDIENYFIGGVEVVTDVEVISAVQHAFNKVQVNLTVSGLDGNYELLVLNVEDVYGNVTELQGMEFSYVGVDEYFLNSSIDIYPNPASEYVNVSFVSLEEFDFVFTVVDITGRQMRHTEYAAKPGANEFRIDLSDLDQGVFLLRMQGAKGILTKKLIVR